MWKENPDSYLKRLMFISEIIFRLNRSGKSQIPITEMHRLVYIFQEIYGIYYYRDFEFILYKPHSTLLGGDIAILAYWKIIKIVPSDIGYDIELGSKAEYEILKEKAKLPEDEINAIEEFISEIKYCSEKETRVLAIIVYIIQRKELKNIFSVIRYITKNILE